MLAFRRVHDRDTHARMTGCTTVYFYGHGVGNKYGWMSNFFEASFVEGSLTCKWAEQGLMALKAELMDDTASIEKIMHATKPGACKQLGRRVKPWNQELWDREKLNIMVRVTRAKYDQNPMLRKKLIETGTAVLAEASPRDRVWGIGLSIKDAEAGVAWKGQNLLGQALMLVRTELLKEDGGEEEEEGRTVYVRFGSTPPRPNQEKSKSDDGS